nr:reverse transcriptase domain-containing protein [Tanacetum cinerariifolium]
SEFSKDVPSEDGPIDALSGTDESLLAQAVPAIAPERPCSSSSSSARPPSKRYRVSPTPALLALVKLAVMAPTLHYVPIELLPPRKRTVGHDVAYEMSWKDLMKMITEAYCPRNEIHKLESELRNLTVKGTNVVGYTQRF